MTIPTNDLLNQTIQLLDGRTLGFAEYGDPSGEPVFLFHGQPGNRLFHPPEEITRNKNARLIVPDRPGYGLSTLQPDRKIADWVDDIHQLADAQGFNRFPVIGFSAGGPYALACAARTPDRIRSVTLISSAPPLEDTEIRREMSSPVKANRILFKLSPWLALQSFRIFWAISRKNPQDFIEMAKKQSSPADQKAMEDRETFNMLMDSWQENLRIDPRGYVDDAILLMGDWGFDLNEVRKEVQLFWGADDLNSPISIMSYFEACLPASVSHIFPEQGHFGFLKYWHQILESIFQDP